MTRHTHTVIVICLLLAWPCLAQPEPADPAGQDAVSSDMNRGNPFAAILGDAQGSPADTVPVTEYVEPPAVSVETLTLEHLDATAIGAAFQAMSSSFGRVAVIEKTNSLVIFDTEDNLARMVDQIKKIDKPVPGLVVRTVVLRGIDAEVAKAAVEKLCSAHGAVVPVNRTNSLIVCDTAAHAGSILTEIARIDSPLPGLTVASVTLRHLNAKSAQAALVKLCSEAGSISVIERANSLIICDKKPNVDAMLAEIAKIDEPGSGLVVETLSLKFLEAKNLKVVLDKMVTEYGSVAINESTNSVIVCDTPENLSRIRSEVRKADKTPPQIMVEVMILDVQLRDDKEIGINWDLLSSDRKDITYRQNFTTSRLRSTAESTATIGDATVFNSVGLGGDFSVISGSIRHVLHMLQEKRDIEIVASPRAMMVSGQTATIQAVEEIPYKEVMDTAQGGAMALTSTEFKNVGVTLNVTASITDDDYIFLTVDIEHNVRTGQSDTGVPVVDTRKASTSLLLDDGEIVVIGGLRREEKTKETNQIPLLGSVPVVGWLFKNTRTVLNNSELIVLLSPHAREEERIPDGVMTRLERLRNKSLLSTREEAGPQTNATEHWSPGALASRQDDSPALQKHPSPKVLE